MNDYLDLENAFHKIDKNKETEEPKRLVEVYTIAGKQDYFDDDGFPRLDESAEDAEDAPDAHAKSVTIGQRKKFFVKVGRHGRLFNPFGMYSEGTAAKQMRHAGKPEWNFLESEERVFDHYIQFLKSKNPAWLHNAEREF